MTGLATLLFGLAIIVAPIILTGAFMLPGIEDAFAGTTVNRPAKSGPALFFYLLGFRVAPLLRVFA